MLCNILVCLAVWLAIAGHTVVDKIFAIIFPITAFVAAGFEHSVANMYFIPIGLLLADTAAVPAGVNLASLNVGGFLSNLVPVTLGNIVGGSVMVAAVYYVIYRQPALAVRRTGTERTRETDFVAQTTRSTDHREPR